jgi:hypothetical protein
MWNQKTKRQNDTLLKFTAPSSLKDKAQQLAEQRNLSLAAFLRLVLTEYVKNKS